VLGKCNVLWSVGVWRSASARRVVALMYGGGIGVVSFRPVTAFRCRLSLGGRGRGEWMGERGGGKREASRS